MYSEQRPYKKRFNRNETNRPSYTPPVVEPEPIDPHTAARIAALVRIIDAGRVVNKLCALSNRCRADSHRIGRYPGNTDRPSLEDLEHRAQWEETRVKAIRSAFTERTTMLQQTQLEEGTIVDNYQDEGWEPEDTDYEDGQFGR